MKKLIALILGLIGFLSVNSAADAASLSLSPSSGSVGQGQQFSVSVNVNTGGEAVNAVEAVIVFPADTLRATYVSHSGSGFDITAESSIGNGVVRIAKAKLPPAVVGSRKVATVGFTAVSGGTATISISSESKVLRESDSANILGGSSGATYTVGAAVQKPTTKTSQPGATQALQAPQAAPAESTIQAPQDTTSPKIDNVQVLNLGIQTATITWKTDEKADSQVEYGFVIDRREKKALYFFTAQSEDMVTDHSLSIPSKTLIPGYRYHYRISSKDGSGNQTTSKDSTFLVPGYPLKVSVVDQASRKIKDIKVSLPSIGVEGTTDKNGQVLFSDLPTGNFPVVAEYQGEKNLSEASVNADKNNAVVLTLSKKTTKLPIATSVFSFILILLLGVIFFLWRYYRIRKFH